MIMAVYVVVAGGKRILQNPASVIVEQPKE